MARFVHRIRPWADHFLVAWSINGTVDNSSAIVRPVMVMHSPWRAPWSSNILEHLPAPGRPDESVRPVAAGRPATIGIDDACSWIARPYRLCRLLTRLIIGGANDAALPNVYRLRGVAYLQNDDIDSAIRDFNEAINRRQG